MAIHDVQQLSPYVPESRVLWVFVDGDRENRACLFCPTAADIPAKIEEYVVELDKRDHEPTAPKRYSVIRICAALGQMGLMDRLEAWLKTKYYNGLKAWTAFIVAQEFSSDYPMFADYLGEAQEELGVDDATVAAILAAAEV